MFSFPGQYLSYQVICVLFLDIFMQVVLNDQMYSISNQPAGGRFFICKIYFYSILSFAKVYYVAVLEFSDRFYKFLLSWFLQFSFQSHLYFLSYAFLFVLAQSC